MRWPTPRLSLSQILTPRTIAVIGASDDLRKFGARVFDNIIHGGFAGQVLPVNPKRKEVLGRPAFATVDDLPSAVDIAVVAVPVGAAQAQVEACAARGVGCCVVITAGFGEVDRDGAELQNRIVDIARQSGMRIIGPNCLGLLNTHARLLLNSSPSMKVTPLASGAIGHASQSGALMATLFNRGADDGARFSVSVSLGNQADLELADFIEYFADDPSTRVVTLYVEGFRDAGRFVRAVRRCREAGKPVLMMKSGMTESGARVTRSHTASLASSAAVLEAVCRESGVILVDDIRGMIQAAALLSKTRPPDGDGICVVSGSGGAAAMTADRMSRRGLRLARFDADTVQRLEEIYEPSQLGNPLDVGAMRDKSFTAIDDGGLSIAAKDPDVAAFLVPVTTAPMIGTATRAMAEASLAAGKPAVFVVVQGSADDGARAALKELGAPCFETLDEALRVLECWLASAPPKPHQSPTARPTDLPSEPALADLDDARLTEPEVKQLVASYGMPVTTEAVAVDLDEALRTAERMGYPVALKAVSRTLFHKSDVGAVKLGIENGPALRTAWEEIAIALDPAPLTGLVSQMAYGEVEAIAGLKHDPEFGPMVLFGVGGLLAETLGDVCVAPCPVSSTRVCVLLRQLTLWPVLAGTRGRPAADVESFAEIVSRLSWLGHDAQHRIAELDLNPVIVRTRGQGSIVVDGAGTLTPPEA